ncbi:hypothetical protein KL948_005398 [Ogataea haglerorum]|nr:hypothetical protein KL915_005383 [Ogataea haglerorum]KAG7712931.1 hypothetical protein KL913_005401 [Ogataea haglerorum]KAG7723865.1 hypothetical protein KL948_005398 [Ogataea haglerorum]KAG7743837.1 hypothetical protein KL912_005383 [Ogataea haglerorum]KAG7762370.1 hypothetical protein KL931_005381 [Ogataea haglerorum]
MVCIHTENQNQGDFYPFVLLEISVLHESPLGHLRYRLTDVPPQPNSPPDNVFNPDQPTRDLKSRTQIPLVRTSSKLVVNCAPDGHKDLPNSSTKPQRVPPESRSQCGMASEKGPRHPTLRANPYPEVTDLFCRLPLSTLFYQLEAVNLGDLLRL